MVHSVYSVKAVFLRELISNAAEAYEKLRYDAIGNPAFLGDDPKPRITLTIDPDKRTLRQRPEIDESGRVVMSGGDSRRA
jgi:molecular chaperone HtpG